jgi:hypothetical protein
METPTATCAQVALGIAAIPSKRRAEKIKRAIRITIHLSFVQRWWIFWPAAGEEKGRLRATVEENL